LCIAAIPGSRNTAAAAVAVAVAAARSLALQLWLRKAWLCTKVKATLILQAPLLLLVLPGLATWRFVNSPLPLACPCCHATPTLLPMQTAFPHLLLLPLLLQTTTCNHILLLLCLPPCRHRRRRCSIARQQRLSSNNPIFLLQALP
jgi:hypothetical protein